MSTKQIFINVKVENKEQVVDIGELKNFKEQLELKIFNVIDKFRFGKMKINDTFKLKFKNSPKKNASFEKGSYKITIFATCIPIKSDVKTNFDVCLKLVLKKDLKEEIKKKEQEGKNIKENVRRDSSDYDFKYSVMDDVYMTKMMENCHKLCHFTKGYTFNEYTINVNGSAIAEVDNTSYWFEITLPEFEKFKQEKAPKSIKGNHRLDYSLCNPENETLKVLQVCMKKKNRERLCL